MNIIPLLPFFDLDAETYNQQGLYQAIRAVCGEERATIIINKLARYMLRVTSPNGTVVSTDSVLTRLRSNCVDADLILDINFNDHHKLTTDEYSYRLCWGDVDFVIAFKDRIPVQQGKLWTSGSFDRTAHGEEHATIIKSGITPNAVLCDTDIDGLRKQIIAAFGGKWESNDPGHRATHFEEVFQCGLHINTALGLGYSSKLILFAAYFHDLFAWSRNNHHHMSMDWMFSTDHHVILDNLSPSEINDVAWACGQHRASYKGTFRNPFCELINSADRGFPTDVPNMLARAVLYREELYPDMSADERTAGAIAHLKEKYGHGGYARYPEMYKKVFGGSLDAMRINIAVL